MSCQLIRDRLFRQVSESWFCRESRSEEKSYLLGLDFILPNNDCLEVLVEMRGPNELAVHDMGTAEEFMRRNGIDLSSRRQENRRERVKQITERFNTEFDGHRIQKVDSAERLWKTVLLVSETVKSVTSMVETRRAQPEQDFKERVYGYFVKHNVRVDRDYSIDGYTKKNNFDLRLNGPDQMLVRTISQKQTSRVQSQIERAWYAFDDVRQEGHVYEPGIIYDDTDEERKNAWRREHFQMLRKRDIPTYGFEANQDQLYELGMRHRN